MWLKEKSAVPLVELADNRSVKLTAWTAALQQSVVRGEPTVASGSPVQSLL